MLYNNIVDVRSPVVLECRTAEGKYIVNEVHLHLKWFKIRSDFKVSPRKLSPSSIWKGRVYSGTNLSEIYVFGIKYWICQHSSTFNEKKDSAFVLLDYIHVGGDILSSDGKRATELFGVHDQKLDWTRNAVQY